MSNDANDWVFTEGDVSQTPPSLEQLENDDIPAIKFKLGRLKAQRTRISFRQWCAEYPWASELTRSPGLFWFLILAGIYFFVGGGFVAVKLYDSAILGSIMMAVPIGIFLGSRIEIAIREHRINSSINQLIKQGRRILAKRQRERDRTKTILAHREEREKEEADRRERKRLEEERRKNLSGYKIACYFCNRLFPVEDRCHREAKVGAFRGVGFGRFGLFLNTGDITTQVDTCPPCARRIDDQNSEALIVVWVIIGVFIGLFVLLPVLIAVIASSVK